MSLTTNNPAPDLLERSNRPARSSFRWVILSLLVLATTLNYLDRLTFAVLGNTKLNLTKAEFGNLNATFAITYAVGNVVAGGWLDWIGTRIGYAISLIAWSYASISHALMRTVLGFGFSRAFLGLAEAPNFPAATKTIAEWFPRRERAFAMGWVNAGSNFGSILAPLVVLKLADAYSWPLAFIITGTFGMLWVVLWYPIYRKPAEHARVSAEELALINSDAPEPTTVVRWRTLLAHRQTWAFVLGKFFTDAVFWFFLSWSPTFLSDHYGVKISLSEVGPPLVIIAGMAATGSIAGGWLSSFLIRRGWSTNAARKTTLLICALCVLPVSQCVLPAVNPRNVWIAVVLLGLASAAHQGFSSNLFTLVSDTFPRRTVGSVAGLGGAFGWIGAATSASLTGYVLTWTHNDYRLLFYAASTAYLLALASIHLASPRLEPVVIADTGLCQKCGYDLRGSTGICPKCGTPM